MHDVNAHQYPMVRGSGAFLVCVGVALILAVLWPASAPVNLRVLGIGAIVGIVAMAIMRIRFPLGRPKAVHILVMCAAVVLQLFAFSFVFSRLPPDVQPEIRWLWALFIVGLHFIPMGLALGKRIVMLGLACAVIAAAALFVGLLPFVWVIVIDGLLKIGFGASMAVTGL